MKIERASASNRLGRRGDADFGSGDEMVFWVELGHGSPPFRNAACPDRPSCALTIVKLVCERALTIFGNVALARRMADFWTNDSQTEWLKCQRSADIFNLGSQQTELDKQLSRPKHFCGNRKALGDRCFIGDAVDPLQFGRDPRETAELVFDPLHDVIANFGRMTLARDGKSFGR